MLATPETTVPRLGSYYLQTYGCQMNQYDSELLAWMLEGMGLAASDDAERADVAVFNTCCIRDNADQKVYGRMGDFKRYKAQHPRQVLAVVGCLAQKDGEDFLNRFPQVDLVLGTHNVRELPEMVLKVQSGEGRFVRAEKQGDTFDLLARPTRRFSAMVTISMGCDQWCTFCIVPYVRGRLKSKPVLQVVSEVRRLAREGHREVLLLGQNVNDYGRDLEPRSDFADLIDALRGAPGLDRLRFTSPHPAYFTQRVIEAMAANPAMCEHVHLPLQAGDDQVLKRMKRGYTGAEFLDLAARMRGAIPGLALSTDIIVGFPGETEEQFQRTLDLVRQARFDSAFMFAYSPRPGTPGALFKDQIPEDERLDRLYRLIELQNSISMELNAIRLGRVAEVLVEGPSKKDASRYTGRTRCGRLVHFEAEGDLTGLMARVRLEQHFTWGFVGELQEHETRPGDWSRAAA
ncbi:tRNA (N6-isopentenyl adenosine(37)-C2)-methylthiotransferase MiaB [bacterium CPR1]|nr:tRNA (N6-isopentenyl adenosine(37)-C2)-methylthiotransferase MiaB [bacterium CPR1]